MKSNVLFLLIDGLRADKIFSDTKSTQTPNIDFLINKGAYFCNAISSSDYTSFCIESIFNSRFPIGCSTLSENFYKIYDPKINLLSVFKNYGYHLYGTLEESLCLLGMNEPLENTDVLFKKLETNIYNGLGLRILEKLKNDNMKEPWFYYVHFMDLHRPFHVPEDQLHLSLNERYDKNINEIDSWIGKILSEIDLDKTLVVITADHGEYISPLKAFNAPANSHFLKKRLKNFVKSLIPKTYQPMIHKKKKKIIGQIKTRNLSTHEKRAAIRTRVGKERELFDDIQKIPLLFVGGGIQSQPPINQQVRSVDIIPNILDIVGITNSLEKIHGRSILPLMENKKLEPQPVYMESGYSKTSTEVPDAVMGIRTDKYKFFRDVHNPQKNIHLYDLKNDPDELENIFKEHPDIISKMENILQNIINSKFVESPKTKLTPDEEKKVKEELRKMGYV